MFYFHHINIYKIKTCDPIEPDDNDLNHKKDTITIMQQCLDMDLNTIVLESTLSDIMNIFKLKDHARKK
jgi:hypothetical protein